MTYFYTAAEIVQKIKDIDTDIATARKAQQYSYDQGPVGQFGVQKGSISAMLKERENWESLLHEHYPDEYEIQPKIVFNEAGFISG